VLIFHRPPQSLHENIVHPPATAVPCSPDARRLQAAGDASAVYCTPWSVLKISGEPSHNAASNASRQNSPSKVFDNRHDKHATTEPVHDHRPSTSNPAAWARSDVAGPHLVGPHDLHISQQIRVNPMLCRVLRQSWLRVDRFQAPSVAAAVRRGRDRCRTSCPSSRTEARRLQVLLIDPTHQCQVLRRLTQRTIVPTRSVQSQQFALPTNAQLRMLRLDALRLNSIESGSFFFNQPNSIWSRPICSYNSQPRRPALGRRGGDRPRTAPSRPPATASSTVRLASYGRQRPRRVGSSCGLPAPPPTPPRLHARLDPPSFRHVNLPVLANPNRNPT